MTKYELWIKLEEVEHLAREIRLELIAQAQAQVDKYGSLHLVRTDLPTHVKNVFAKNKIDTIQDLLNYGDPFGLPGIGKKTADDIREYLLDNYDIELEKEI